MFGPIRAPGWK